MAGPSRRRRGFGPRRVKPGHDNSAASIRDNVGEGTLCSVDRVRSLTRAWSAFLDAPVGLYARSDSVDHLETLGPWRGIRAPALVGHSRDSGQRDGGRDRQGRRNGGAPSRGARPFGLQFTTLVDRRQRNLTRCHDQLGKAHGSGGPPEVWQQGKDHAQWLPPSFCKAFGKLLFSLLYFVFFIDGLDEKSSYQAPIFSFPCCHRSPGNRTSK